MKKKYNAFTLLELSIVLVISSILLTLSFNSGKYFLEQNHIRATRIKLDTIQNALDAYLIQNKRLPCPASLSSSSGEELSSCVSSQGGLFVNDGVARGWIPYEELDLTSDVAYDSWNSKITYSVSVDATSDFMKMNDETPRITIYDNDTALAGITTKAVYSLNSHGKNKLGAYNKTGSSNPTSGISGSERINIPTNNSSDEFVYFSNYKDGDDIGKYKTRMQMLINGNIEDVSCYITSVIISNLLTDAGITDSPTFPMPSDNFLKYGNSLISEYENYKIKCFKYGRLGVSANE